VARGNELARNREQAQVRRCQHGLLPVLLREVLFAPRLRSGRGCDAATTTVSYRLRSTRIGAWRPQRRRNEAISEAVVTGMGSG
jgi:hypothetical protein